MEPTATSDAVQDYQAVREHAGRLDALPWTVLRLTGPDSATFLQGLATQDLEHISQSEVAETFFLNEKGRPVALAWVWIAPDGSSALVFTEESVRGALAQHLGRFRIMEEVEIEELVVPALRVYAGPERDQLLTGDAGCLTNAIAMSSAPFSFLLAPGADADSVTSPAAASPAAESSVVASPSPKLVDSLAYEVWRLSQGIPRAGIDFDLDRIVTEVNRPEAISLTKGCYVGQEIVARTSGRGHVRRLRTGFRFAWPGAPLPPRAEIQIEGRAVGFVTSSAPEPGSGDGLAMGYLSTDVSSGALPQAGNALTVAGHEGPILLRPAPWPL